MEMMYVEMAAPSRLRLMPSKDVGFDISLAVSHATPKRQKEEMADLCENRRQDEGLSMREVASPWITTR